MFILTERNHEVFVVARDKDVLLKLLDENNVHYELFGVHRKNIILKYFAIIEILWSYIQIISRIKPDIIISKASFYSVFLSRFRKSKSIIFPDSEVVTLTNRIVAPMADRVITPSSFQLSFGRKHLRIPGLFEDCYLHPSVFLFDEKLLEKLEIRKPYVILRFIGWNANHDFGESGISESQKSEIVDYLRKDYHVYITSEKELPDELKDYKIRIPASAIHHVLAGADLYIGDSQTMASEAALLGTPSIRCNSFVGVDDMSNFKILEEKYNLLVNVHNTNNIFPFIERLVSPDQKLSWQNKRNEYYRFTGNPNDIIVRFIEEIQL